MLDVRLLQETVESAVCDLLDRIAPYIRERREVNPNTWRNLIWLYRRFRGIPGTAAAFGPHDKPHKSR